MFTFLVLVNNVDKADNVAVLKNSVLVHVAFSMEGVLNFVTVVKIFFKK